ncbi:MAG: ADP-ribosylglycohydrolase family protein [Lachnospiraceae bacterium]|jgi:ADP-ribosylglycohydrolase|nr:ADP-ribosylglycohydrolase family protein [Lachnospiraceae bacterium]
MEMIKDGIIGLCVADALGVPVEFLSRNFLQRNPVVDMRGYGTYNQPPGTWSDDTSMTLCLLDSLTNGLDYADMMRKFALWMNNAEYTAYDEVFDVGVTTGKALSEFAKGTDPLLCGGSGEYDNGNGSLMRILPLIFHLRSFFGDVFAYNDKAFDIIHNVSSLTHAHSRSHVACGIYLSVANRLLESKNINTAFSAGMNDAKRYYRSKNRYYDELAYFDRLYDDDFRYTAKENIKSSGYVVDTLEAAFWCLLTTECYEDCVLKAVNLGEDTDTVAAVTGGLAGLFYGYKAIPEKWLKQIARLDFIINLCEKAERVI